MKLPKLSQVLTMLLIALSACAIWDYFVDKTDDRLEALIKILRSDNVIGEESELPFDNDPRVTGSLGNNRS